MIQQLLRMGVRATTKDMFKNAAKGMIVDKAYNMANQAVWDTKKKVGKEIGDIKTNISAIPSDMAKEFQKQSYHHHVRQPFSINPYNPSYNVATDTHQLYTSTPQVDKWDNLQLAEAMSMREFKR